MQRYSDDAMDLFHIVSAIMYRSVGWGGGLKSSSEVSSILGK